MPSASSTLAKKVKLPVDRNGHPVNVDDVLMWDDGTVMKVGMLTYYGKGLDIVGSWIAEDESGEDFTDNIKAAVNLTWHK